MGAHGWVAGSASHGSISLSGGGLISVEAPRHPGHLSSIELDAVVNLFFIAFHDLYSVFCCLKIELPNLKTKATIQISEKKAAAPS